MAKDAKGHGSDGKGASAASHDYGRTIGIGPAARPEFPHPDSPTGRAMTVRGEGPQGRLPLDGVTDKDAANALAQDHPKSEPVPVHGGAGGPTQYTGSAMVGRSLKNTAPQPSRIAARDAARTMAPKAKSVSTGYGYNGSFDIRSHPHYEK
jgi:hypothetical protein